ncbi:peroxiredoxin [Mucor ambiguus]|uniref:Peroxiredoxin n=1 Tax=Mucor ambiguus TaxID=91626 RepID=A0A0C9MJG9_9FUNG|nr:peroxiredoxin [Mucor ambiguus]
MTMLMTENSFTATPLDCEVSNRKRRRVEDGVDNTLETNSTSTATSLLMVNPVTQQFNRQNMVAPDFNCSAVLHNQITRLQLSSLFSRYKAVVLFFYGCDFTPTACKDLALIHNHFERLASFNTLPLAMSTDTEMVHKAFLTQPLLGFIPSFPLVSDTTRSVSRHFNVINSETGLAQRSAFIIDSTRQIPFAT